jgi:hypothetical protein
MRTRHVLVAAAAVLGLVAGFAVLRTTSDDSPASAESCPVFHPSSQVSTHKDATILAQDPYHYRVERHGNELEFSVMLLNQPVYYWVDTGEQVVFDSIQEAQAQGSAVERDTTRFPVPENNDVRVKVVALAPASLIYVALTTDDRGVVRVRELDPRTAISASDECLAQA